MSRISPATGTTNLSDVALSRLVSGGDAIDVGVLRSIPSKATCLDHRALCWFRTSSVIYSDKTNQEQPRKQRREGL